MPSGAAETKPTQRHRHLEFTADYGRMGWQKASGQSKRGQAEDAISRLKQVLGGGLRSRIDQCQATEVAVTVQALNRVLEPGRPISARIT